MSAANALSRTFRCFRRFALNRAITSSVFLQQQRSFVRISRDSFDEIEDRDLRSAPASERGLTQEEFDALSKDEQADIIAREEEMMEEEGDESDAPPVLTEEEIEALSPEDRELYLEFLTERGLTDEEFETFSEDLQAELNARHEEAMEEEGEESDEQQPVLTEEEIDDLSPEERDSYLESLCERGLTDEEYNAFSEDLQAELDARQEEMEEEMEEEGEESDEQQPVLTEEEIDDLSPEERDSYLESLCERGLTDEEIETFSEDLQAELNARQEAMEEEGEEWDVQQPVLNDKEMDNLSPEECESYLEFLCHQRGWSDEEFNTFSKYLQAELKARMKAKREEVEYNREIEYNRENEEEENNRKNAEVELDEHGDILIKYNENFNQWKLTNDMSSEFKLKYRDIDPEVEELEERFATNKKYGLADMIDRFEQVLDEYDPKDPDSEDLDSEDPNPEEPSLEQMAIDPSFFATRTERVIPKVPGLDYSQHQPTERPRAIDSRDPNARRDPEPVLEPYGVRLERSNDEMVSAAIAAGPAVHQTSFIDHQYNTTLTPHWMNMQTANPELIPPKRGANYEDPTSVKYPFIPVLENPRDLEEASLLHRLLQYNRLDATRQFLKLERLRRQLAYQRQHRDLTAYCKKLCSKLPAERVDLKEVKPKLKNLPTHMPGEYLNEMHPHNIPTETSWMHSLMWLVHDNIKENGKLSQLEKEQFMRTTQRFCSYAYRQMMKDKAAGYYRVMSTPPMMETAEEREARAPTAPRIPTPMQSSLLRKAAILIRTSSAQ